MSHIRILPEILSNKIAAGEVVERPASVVKELVENALDAGSSRIIVEVEKGGRKLIRVSDNGCGMSYDDALLSVERYATSKIRDDADLFSIRTLGFRGEALPSIAAVSRFVMETRAESSDSGTRIEIQGGTLRNVSELGAPVGTMITVKDLYFNTPARRKFMKSAGTEMGHIGDTLAGIALGQPGVRFSLLHNGKDLRNWPAVDNPLQRAGDVLGQNLQRELCPVGYEGENIRISGRISLPSQYRATSSSIYLYVNGRWIKDRMVQHAIFSGYRGRLMKGQFPLAVLFITLAPDQVDVNVHPAKSEVRFVQQKAVHQAVSHAVSAALRQAGYDKEVGNDGADEIPAAHLPENRQSFSARTLPFSEAEKIPPPHPSEISEGLSSYASLTGEKETVTPFQQKEEEVSAHRQSIPAENTSDINRIPDKRQGKKTFRELRIIGQFHRTYILCESDRGLILIDQHAAHERIVYEELKERAAKHKSLSQRLLIPETLELSYKETAMMEKLLPRFAENGFEIEPFGGNTFAVKSAPAILAEKEISPLIAEILERMTEIGVDTEADLEKNRDEMLILTACHGAVRAGQTLSREEMQALLRQMDQCENPSNCPHGRPTWIRWGVRFLEKSFRRTV